MVRCKFWSVPETQRQDREGAALKTECRLIPSGIATGFRLPAWRVAGGWRSVIVSARVRHAAGIAPRTVILRGSGSERCCRRPRKAELAGHTAEMRPSGLVVPAERGIGRLSRCPGSAGRRSRIGEAARLGPLWHTR